MDCDNDGNGVDCGWYIDLWIVGTVKMYNCVVLVNGNIIKFDIVVLLLS